MQSCPPPRRGKFVCLAAARHDVLGQSLRSKTLKSMHIEKLSHHRGLVGPIALTLHEAWGDLPPWADLGAIEERLMAGAAHADFPHTLVAVTPGGAWAAAGSVKLFELSSQPDKVHWVGEIFVLPEHRGRGLGSRITTALADHAFSAGASQIYLYTPDQQALYARLGWQEVSKDVVNGETVSIMELHR